MSRDEGYLLDNQQAGAGRRLEALAELFDPVTFRHINALGIAPGWSCWEVGAGGPSVPRWLAHRVGPTGHILATDLDTSWLAEPAPYEARVHDVGAEPPPGGPYDLVHARLVLVHVRERDVALRSMLASVRPGGWLLVEDADPGLQPLLCPDEAGPEQELANRLRRGFRQLMHERDVDLAYGRTLPRRLREAGLVDVQADAFFPLTSPACAVLERATVEQVGEQLVTAGLATADEIDRHIEAVDSGRLDLATAPLVSAWGRRG